MKKNMGNSDRVIRSLLVLGIIILIVTGVIQGIWALLLGIIALILLITVLTGTCRIYAWLGVSTRKHEKPQTSDDS